MEILERKPGAQLDFAAWSHGHSNGAELRGINETVRRAEIDFVQGVENFAAELEVESFRNAKRALQRVSPMASPYYALSPPLLTRQP